MPKTKKKVYNPISKEQPWERYQYAVDMIEYYSKKRKKDPRVYREENGPFGRDPEMEEALRTGKIGIGPELAWKIKSYLPGISFRYLMYGEYPVWPSPPEALPPARRQPERNEGKENVFMLIVRMKEAIERHEKEIRELRAIIEEMKKS